MSKYAERMAFKGMRSARERLHATTFLIGFMCGDTFIDTLRSIWAIINIIFASVVVVRTRIDAWTPAKRNQWEEGPTHKAAKQWMKANWWAAMYSTRNAHFMDFACARATFWLVTIAAMSIDDTKESKKEIEKKRRRNCRHCAIRRTRALLLTPPLALLKRIIFTATKHSHTYLLSVTLDLRDDRGDRMHKRMMSICH